ncbi:Ulp1 protease family [Abeliophyllum distichum]|uniref:Ulp1 protease family n=1 Tax=Abeliophyllum distichum TaxID=126358 RepID=A0ABD1V6I5_9LAMI
MWFNISGKLLRFSMEEFCVVTRLKCVGCDDSSMLRKGPSVLRQRYFSHLKSIYKKDVEDVFKALPTNMANEDVVKIGILYRTTSFLFTTPYRKQVSDATFSLIEFVEIERLAWGKELFNNTFNYLKTALTKRAYDEVIRKNIFTYRLYGFLLAFQIWIYESVPSIDGEIWKRLYHTWPRLLNWTNPSTRVTAIQLEKLVFDLPDLEIRGIQPNEDEMGASYLAGFFQSYRADPDIDDDNDFVDPPVRDELKDYGEKLNKIMLDIRLRQDQIISQQIDLKDDLRKMKLSVDEKINGFIDELRRKVTKNSTSHVYPSPIVIYTDLAKMKTKVDEWERVPKEWLRSHDSLQGVFDKKEWT